VSLDWNRDLEDLWQTVFCQRPAIASNLYGFIDCCWCCAEVFRKGNESSDGFPLQVPSPTSRFHALLRPALKVRIGETSVDGRCGHFVVVTCLPSSPNAEVSMNHET
jgi:hypothetical protein